MVNLPVYLDKSRIPNKHQWEATASSNNIPLIFPDSFDLQSAPICGEGQINHPQGKTEVVLDGARCSFQIDCYTIDCLPENIFDESAQNTASSYNLSITFRWDSSIRPNAVAAQLTAATLISATSGIISWPRAKNGWCGDNDAFKKIRDAAYREIKTLSKIGFNKASLFGPAVEVNPFKPGRIKCPRCEWKFQLKDAKAWDGEKCLKCGQLISLINRI